MSEIRIANFFRLTAANGLVYRFQNYYVNDSIQYLSEQYTFAPFQSQGSMAALNGDNEQLRVLFPNVEYSLRLLEQADGNRLSELRLTTAWLTGSGQIANTLTDFYVGIGSGFSETTLELRFRSAIDSVGSEFPGRTLTKDLVGPLPLNAELFLR
jgi:hypothetical protein